MHEPTRAKVNGHVPRNRYAEQQVRPIAARHAQRRRPGNSRAPARQRCWPLPEEEMRRRKARRAPPPPGLLAQPPEEPPVTPDAKPAAGGGPKLGGSPPRPGGSPPKPGGSPEPRRGAEEGGSAPASPEAAAAAADEASSGGWVVVERYASRGRSNERRPRPTSPASREAQRADASADATVPAHATPGGGSGGFSGGSGGFSGGSGGSGGSSGGGKPVPEKRALYSIKRRDSSAQLVLECRLEKELEAARERERALEEALKQRSEAFSELFVCPITHEPMQDPVSAADGQTYERRAIEEWLRKGDFKGGVPTSPLTGEPLKDKTLRPNFLARALRAGIS